MKTMQINKQMTPKVSIIVPIYKTEKYLERCLNSLIKQSLRDIEIILVDDGSPDSCSKIYDKYKKNDNRIKVIHKENQGLGFARNSGLEISTGEYVGFVDSDDFVDTEMFEKLYTSAKKNNSQVAYCNVNYYKSGKVIKMSNFVDSEIVWEGTSEIKSFLLDLISAPVSFKRDTVYGASVWKGIFKNNIFKKFNIKFVSERILISEDTIFNIDFIPYTNKISMIPDHLYYYCFNEESLTNTYKANRFEANKILYKEKRTRFAKKFKIDDYILERFAKDFISKARIAIIHEVSNIHIIGIKNVYLHIKTICNDSELINALNNINVTKLPFKQAVFSICIKHKYILIIILLTFLNSKINN